MTQPTRGENITFILVIFYFFLKNFNKLGNVTNIVQMKTVKLVVFLDGL